MKKYIPKIIIMILALCLVVLILGFILVRNFLPDEIYIPPINLPQIILVTPAPYPTYTFFPTYTLIVPTPGLKWVWRNLSLYNWKVEIPSDWTIAEMDRIPEPSDSIGLGHDCSNYQLISPDRLRFINILMPCYPSGGTGGQCSHDITFIQAIGTEQYLVRRPYNGNSFLYEIATKGIYEDVTGTHSGYVCENPPIYIYFYWELGKTSEEIYTDFRDVDRIMLSLLTANNNFQVP